MAHPAIRASLSWNECARLLAYAERCDPAAAHHLRPLLDQGRVDDYLTDPVWHRLLRWDMDFPEGVVEVPLGVWLLLYVFDALRPGGADALILADYLATLLTATVRAGADDVIVPEGSDLVGWLEVLSDPEASLGTVLATGEAILLYLGLFFDGSSGGGRACRPLGVAAYERVAGGGYGPAELHTAAGALARRFDPSVEACRRLGRSLRRLDGPVPMERLLRAHPFYALS